MTDVKHSPASETDHGQLILPVALLQEFLATAQASGSSPAEYLRYCLDLGQDVAKVLPRPQQAPAVPTPDLLSGLAAVLADPKRSTTFRRIQENPAPRISVDPSAPTRAKRTHAKGLVEHGVLDSLGRFIPNGAEAAQPVPPTLPG